MSGLTADVIENSSGQRLLVDGYPAQPNRILEYLAGTCDGSTTTVRSGTYTLQNVTAEQGGSTAYQVVTGSEIYYCPPPGTKKVTYRFTFSVRWVPNSTHSINHYKFYIDDNEVLRARHNISAQYIEERRTFEWVIPVGNTTDFPSGRVATWTQPRRLYMTFRWYGTVNHANNHGTTYWDGTTSNQFNIPQLSIIATT
jgi:hypothetical protein